MNKEDFIKKLEHLDLPEVESKRHKHNLQLVLLGKNSDFHSGRKRNRFIFNTHFMSSFKKILPLSLVASFAFVLIFHQTFQDVPQTAKAREIVTQALQKISNSDQRSSAEELKIQRTLRILEAALTSDELQYLGDTTYPDGTIYKKLSFTNDDLSNELTLLINPNGSSTNAIRLEGFKQSIESKVEVQFKDGKVINLEEVNQKLHPENPPVGWVRDLVHLENEGTINTFESRKSEEQKKRQKGFYDGPEMKNFSLMQDQLIPVIESADVFVTGFGYAAEGDKISNITLGIYSITDQKEKRTFAKEIVTQALDKLSAFNSEDANAKLQILSKAKDSSRLKYYSYGENQKPGRKILSFPYENTGVELWVVIDTKENSEKFVNFHFRSEELAFVPGVFGEKINIDISEKGITNFKEVETKLTTNSLQDPLLNYLIQTENNNLADLINKDSTEENENFQKELTALLRKSKVLIFNRGDIKNDQGKREYYLEIYSFNPQKDAQESSANAHELLVKTIDRLKNNPLTEKTLKLQTLEKILKSKDLKYIGEEIRPDGKKVQRVGYYDEDQKKFASVLIDLNDGSGEVLDMNLAQDKVSISTQ